MAYPSRFRSRTLDGQNDGLEEHLEWDLRCELAPESYRAIDYSLLDRDFPRRDQDLPPGTCRARLKDPID